MNVFFEECLSLYGFCIGIVILDVEKSLNVLFLLMIEVLVVKFDVWVEDVGIVCVLLCGNGVKVFCVGGDVCKLVDVCCE